MHLNPWQRFVKWWNADPVHSPIYGSRPRGFTARRSAVYAVLDQCPETWTVKECIEQVRAVTGKGCRRETVAAHRDEGRRPKAPEIKPYSAPTPMDLTPYLTRPPEDTAA